MKRAGPAPWALSRRLAEHGATRGDVLTSDEIHRLAGLTPDPQRGRGVRTLGIRLGLPMAPPSLFTVGNVTYWAVDDIIAWLAATPTPARRAARRAAATYEERVADGVQLARDGVPAEDIAERLSVSVRAVYGWLRAAGVPRPAKQAGRPAKRQPAGVLALAVDLYLDGLSAERAAHLTRLTAAEVVGAVRRAGCELRPSGRRLSSSPLS